MLLLRTRAEIVAPRVDNILARFPTAQSMAGESLEFVQGSLRSFGLRWRAARIHELARIVTQQHHGEVPVDLDSLLALPGVGPYIASATVSTLTGRPVVLTDTNTVRVAKRVAGISLKGDVRRKKEVQSAIAHLMGGRAPAPDWLAVLDLAATVCTPGEPHCLDCPIRRLCAYGRAQGPT
jgi:A/G-specific adenine glycosylase